MNNYHHHAARALATVAALAAALTGCSSEQPLQTQAPRTVFVETIRADSFVSAIAVPGLVRARARAALTFEMPGRIAALGVDMGDQFQRGDLLGRLDDALQTLDVDASKAELASAQARLREAQRAFDRAVTLRKSGNISIAGVDGARAANDTALAAVAAAKASANLAQERLAQARLVAPFAGQVTARLAEPGEMAAANRPILSVIGDPADLEVSFNLPHAHRASVSINENVLVIGQSGAAAGQARITQIGTAAGPMGMFPAVAVLAGSSDMDLYSGNAVTVRLAAPAPPVLSISNTAFVRAANGETIAFVLTDDGESVRRTSIVIGTLGRGRVQVTAGLMQGDKVVSKGADLLTDGQHVSPHEPGVGIARYVQ